MRLLPGVAVSAATASGVHDGGRQHSVKGSSMTQPSIGRIVHYRLTEGDVEAIETRTPQYRTGTSSLGGEYSVFQRNPVHAGQDYPALVVAVFDPSVTTANLMVQLDGHGQYWATSRTEGDEPGHWHWPPRV